MAWRESSRLRDVYQTAGAFPTVTMMDDLHQRTARLVGEIRPEQPASCDDPIPVSQYRDWLRQRKDDEQKKLPAYLALDAYEAVAGRATIAKEDLGPILAAARNRHVVAWD